MAKSRAGSARPSTFGFATALAVTSGGSGYAANDVVAVDVPGAQFKPTLQVDTVTGGAIATAHLLTGGRIPADASGAQPTTKITGAGTGATITLTVAERQS